MAAIREMSGGPNCLPLAGLCSVVMDKPVRSDRLALALTALRTQA